MKRLISLALAAAAMITGAAAQNLNPTVEVTRSYEGRLLEVHKPSFGMAVPDSLLHFDLDFDYSVFDNPYKGAGDFQPYLTDMKPQAVPDPGRTLYVRAGAGWTLHPDLDVVWSPLRTGRFQLNAYASHHSYIGKFRNIFASRKEAAAEDFRLVSRRETHVDGSPYPRTHSGYDMQSQAGLSGSYAWSDGSLLFDLGYEGIHVKDSLLQDGYDAMHVGLRVKSSSQAQDYFFYDAGIRYRFAVDGIRSVGAERQLLDLGDFELDGSFGPVVGGAHRFLVGVEAGFTSYSDLFKAQVGHVYVTPRYVFDRDRWRLSLGVKSGAVINSEDQWMGYKLNGTGGQIVYPDVRIGYEAVRDYLNLYLRVTGGDRIHSFSSMKASHHFFNPWFGRAEGPLLDNGVERFDAAAGLQGNIATRLRYDLRAGYASYRNGLLDAVFAGSNFASVPQELCAGVSFHDYNRFYTQLDFLWDGTAFTFDGSLAYQSTNVWKARMNGFEPARLSGTVRGLYRWNRRVSAGAYAEAASARRGTIRPLSDSISPETWYPARIPGYVDLGLTGEYRTGRNLSVWGQVGNLLDRTIQRHPLYPDSGINFRVGICLNL